MTEPIQCRFPDCRRAALPDQSRCEAHRMRWLAKEPVERPVSGWVAKALAHTLPGKVLS